MRPVTPRRRANAGGALFRALRNADVEAESAYAAVEEVRDMAGHNVVVEIGARIDRVETSLGARIDTPAARIDTLQKALRPLVIAASVALLSAVGGGLFALLKS